MSSETGAVNRYPVPHNDACFARSAVVGHVGERQAPAAEHPVEAEPKRVALMRGPVASDEHPFAGIATDRDPRNAGAFLADAGRAARTVRSKRVAGPAEGADFIGALVPVVVDVPFCFDVDLLTCAVAATLDAVAVGLVEDRVRRPRVRGASSRDALPDPARRVLPGAVRARPARGRVLPARAAGRRALGSVAAPAGASASDRVFDRLFRATEQHQEQEGRSSMHAEQGTPARRRVNRRPG